MVVGAGQAGLSVSHSVTRRGVDHIVLERHRIGRSWRVNRWDTFCLVTPNSQCQLPGFPYAGADPHGFMMRDEIVDHLAAYGRSCGPPVVEGIAVTRLAPTTSVGSWSTRLAAAHRDHVMVTTGPYQVPRTPRLAARLPDDVTQVHSADYTSLERLPPGVVLVVGSGESGCRVAEDLHLAGCAVHLATDSAPRVARCG